MGYPRFPRPSTAFERGEADNSPRISSPKSTSGLKIATIAHDSDAAKRHINDLLAHGPGKTYSRRAETDPATYILYMDQPAPWARESVERKHPDETSDKDSRAMPFGLVLSGPPASSDNSSQLPRRPPSTTANYTRFFNEKGTVEPW